MFSEVTEVRDAIHLLTPRAIRLMKDVGKRLLDGFGTITISIWTKNRPQRKSHVSGEQKGAWRTSWKKPSSSITEIRPKARLWKSSLRTAADQTRPDLRGNAGQRFCLRGTSRWHPALRCRSLPPDAARRTA